MVRDARRRQHANGLWRSDISRLCVQRMVHVNWSRMSRPLRHESTEPVEGKSQIIISSNKNCHNFFNTTADSCENATKHSESEFALEGQSSRGSQHCRSAQLSEGECDDCRSSRGQRNFYETYGERDKTSKRLPGRLGLDCTVSKVNWVMTMSNIEKNVFLLVQY